MTNFDILSTAQSVSLLPGVYPAAADSHCKNHRYVCVARLPATAGQLLRPVVGSGPSDELSLCLQVTPPSTAACGPG